jgi:hypothetical protein
MHRFETILGYNREGIIDNCTLEIFSNGYHEVLNLNRAEVKQLLDLMKEAYVKLGKKFKEKGTLKREK